MAHDSTIEHPTSPTSQPDPHIAWWREREEALAYLNGPATAHLADLAQDPAYHRMLELDRLIGATPARTAAGLAVQLRLVAYYAAGDEGESWPNRRVGAAFDNVLATLDRLAEREAGHG